MAIIRKNTVNFSEIFEYAEREFNVTWNEANDIFFRSKVLNYESYDELELDEIDEHEVPETYTVTDSAYKRGWFILRQFMRDKKLKTLLVLND